MKKFFIPFFVSFPLFYLISFPAQCLDLKNPAPFFSVKTGDDQEMTSDKLKGKVFSLWYETREVAEKNKPLKTALKSFYQTMPEDMKTRYARVPVVKCFPVAWPITKILKYKLEENSKKEGVTIYGDWDGKMFADYEMTDNESNFFLIDNKGFIRYRAAGEIGGEEIKKITEILTTLLKEN